MALLRGFQKTKTSEGDSTKVLDLLEKSYLNRTEGGEFNTVEDAQGLIDMYKKLPQSVNVQSRIADLENTKLKLGAKLTDVLSQKDVFDTQVQEGLDGAAKNNFKNMKSLIGSYAAIYADADARYDEEVMAKIFQRYGTTGNIPTGVLDYRKTLQEKAKFYAQLFNSYNVQDPVTGEVGMLNPEGIAVQIDTNPTNGAVQHIDIVPSGQIDDKNYIRTESNVNVISDRPNKRLPTYLRVNNVGVTADGKPIRGGMLGNVSYQEGVSKSDTGANSFTGVLSPVREKAGFWGTLNVFSDNPAEKLNGSIDSMKENGINFASDAYRYDSQSVPNDSVLQMGSRLFYSTGAGDTILEITGKDFDEKAANLTKYMTGIGKDPTKILPYKVTKDYLVNPEGKSRVQGKVDADYFNQPPVQSQSAVPAAQAGGSPDFSTSSFFGAKNTQTRPSEPVVSDSAPDIVDQGNSFFRKAKNFFSGEGNLPR